MREKYKELFSPMEVDAIGEIMNISIGSSATAVSTLLDRRVDITTPKVDVVSFEEFEFHELEPAVGVEITYIEGLNGKNVMVLKKNDVRNILQILFQSEIPDEDFEMDEMATSAVCEIMNQMMGVSSTALSEFLGERVNISIPVSFEIKSAAEFKEKYFTSNTVMVVVAFKLSIEDCMESEFMTLMDLSLAKRITAASGISMEGEFPEQEPILPEENEVPPTPQSTPVEAPVPAQSAPVPEPVQPLGYGAPQGNQDQAYAAQPGYGVPPGYPVQPGYGVPPGYGAPPGYPMPPGYPAQPYPAQPGYGAPPVGGAPAVGAAPQYTDFGTPQATQPKVIHVEPVKQLNVNETNLAESQGSNLDMIMSVPLQLSVEIGRVRKSVKEILDLSPGTLVVLDKLAGDQADIFVNGQMVARGDVVVVDDCFGVRITEILTARDLLIKK